MKETAKNMMSFMKRLALSAILLVWLFSRINIKDTVNVIRSADIVFLVYALMTFLLINCLLLTRWSIYIRTLGLNAAPRDVVRFFFIGLFGNLFMPSAIGGDIIKVLGLCKGSTQKAKVVASVLLDRLSGFAAIVIVSMTSFTLGYSYINDASLIVPILILGGGSFIIASFLFNKKMYSFGCRIFNAFPKLKEKLMNLHYDIVLMKDSKGMGFLAVGIACLSQVIFSCVFFLVSRALHQDISIVYFFIFVPMICVASSVPSIGGLGVREAGAAYFFTKVGMESGVAVSMSLINFFFMIFVGLIGGAVYVFTLSSGRIQRDISDAV